MDSEWPLREFVKFAPKIFASRGFDGALSKIRFRSKYHTRPLQDAMKSIFREKSMWGGLVGKSTSPNTKVALVSIDNKTQKPVVLSNYNRRGDYSSFYEFERPSRPEQELKIWEQLLWLPRQFQPSLSHSLARSAIISRVHCLTIVLRILLFPNLSLSGKNLTFNSLTSFFHLEQGGMNDTIRCRSKLATLYIECRLK